MNAIPVGGFVESPRGGEGVLSGSQQDVGVVGELQLPVRGVGKVELLAPRPVPPAAQRAPQGVAEADGHDGIQQRVDGGVQVVTGSWGRQRW